jgi:hypothetical protein
MIEQGGNSGNTLDVYSAGARFEPAVLTEVFRGFTQPLREKSGIVFPLDPDHALPNHVRFISHHPTLYILGSGGIVK